MRRLLVANRGEIARRVLAAAAALGIETVAVFAEDDRGSPHVSEADQAVLLGAGPPTDTYLDLEKVLAAARLTGADALHPGYGFLSEDPRLAEGCAAAGLTWVGPPPAAMAAMAHKARAKATVAAAGVPVLPGAVVGSDDPGHQKELAETVGYPLLVKASAGGGGRGMRLVEGPDALAEAVAAARREAAASFGSDEVFVERFVPSPRHIEVQVVADQHGNVLHLFDRECSIQRRHQKVVEEAPAAHVAEDLREQMWSSAVAAARAVDYEGVGTVEFVVGGAGPDGAAAHFLEMNTRLQVEHGVTELVTGVDLVELQLTVADGRPLPFTQDEVLVGGHAIEVRLCAERPREDHRPTPGRVLHAQWPSGEGIRVDAGVETGSTVTTTYDSLLAKVMAVGDRRAVAAARLRAALSGPLELDGVETNRQMLAAVLGEDDFGAGRTTTDYLDAHPEVVAAGLDARTRRRHAAAAALFLERTRISGSVVPGVPPSWRNVGHAQHQDHLTDGDDRLSVAVARPAGRLQVVVEGPGDLAAPLGAAVRAAVAATRRGLTGTVDLEVDGVLLRHRVRLHGPVAAVNSSEGQSTFTVGSEFGTEETGAAAGECRAPLPGSVVRVLVAEGDAVEDGAGLVVLEAMKMEHTLRATAGCIVRRVLVTAGDQVDAGDLLVVAEAAE